MFPFKSSILAGCQCSYIQLMFWPTFVDCGLNVNAGVMALYRSALSVLPVLPRTSVRADWCSAPSLVLRASVSILGSFCLDQVSISGSEKFLSLPPPFGWGRVPCAGAGHVCLQGLQGSDACWCLLSAGHLPGDSPHREGALLLFVVQLPAASHPGSVMVCGSQVGCGCSLSL